MKKCCFLLLLMFAVSWSSCKRRVGLPFGDLKGIHYTEVRRAFNTGLVFDKQGYQMSPLWKLYFISDDSVMVFSPKMKRYYGFHVYFDHDSIFNTVDAWLKVKKMNRDSLVFQSQKVENKVILDNEEGSNVFLTFYSEKYLKSRDPKIIQKMALPGPKDIAYIKSRAALSNAHVDSAFSATNPATLKSKSPLAIVSQVKPESTPVEKIDPAMEYLLPEYDITIHKAYKDFSYYFSAYVDEKGQIHFIRSIVPLHQEFAASYPKIIQAIIDGYLKRYVEVTPGSTLGIRHTTIVLLTVNGKKD
jgi:hypothetical protein